MTLVIVRLGRDNDIRALVDSINDAGFFVPDFTNEFREDAGYGKRAYQVQVPIGTTSEQLEPLVRAVGGEILEMEDNT